MKQHFPDPAEITFYKGEMLETVFEIKDFSPSSMEQMTSRKTTAKLQRMEIIEESELKNRLARRNPAWSNRMVLRSNVAFCPTQITDGSYFFNAVQVFAEISA